MPIEKADEALRQYLEAQHVSIHDDPTVVAGAFLRFWSEVPLQGVSDEPTGDMLLFQYGCYDWGHGEKFEFDLTRQLILAGVGDGGEYDGEDEGIRQLRLTWYFACSELLRSAGRFEQWYKSQSDVSMIENLIQEHAQVLGLSVTNPMNVSISLEVV